MSLSHHGATREGLWSIGVKDGVWSIVFERSPNNDTALTSGTLEGFFIAGDYAFLAYQDNGTFGLSKTRNTASYTATSVYETKIYNGGEASLKKKLIGVTVMTEYLPTNGQIVVKYKKDEETSFSAAIFTEATDNSISHSAVNIESSGATLPQDYKEISFRIESTGGAVVTGFSFMEEILGKRTY
jgi:hypothetical protein